MRSAQKLAAVVALTLVLAECTTGPQVQKPLDGNYTGSISGTPFASISFTINGSNITGQGNLTDRDPPLWRGRGDPPHLDISGKLSGRQIEEMNAVIRMEHNDAVDVYDDPPIWNNSDGTLVFNGIFNATGAVTGQFGGQITSKPSVSLGGTWLAAKSSGAAAGILTP